MSTSDATRLRIGALCLLASGVLSAVGLALRGPIINQALDPQAFSVAAASTRHIAAWSLLLPSLCIQLFGFMALWALVRGTRLEGLGLWQMVLSILGNAFFLPFAGIIAFISPPIGQLYLAGNTAAMEVMNAGLAGAFATPFFILSAALLLIGAILTGILLWRAPMLPSWTAIPYVLHALFLTFVAPFSYPLEFIGGLMLLATTVAITLAIWKFTATGQGVAATPAAAQL